MIPATALVAFGASASGTVKIGGQDYTVTVRETQFTYNGSAQDPGVTVSGLSGYTYSYENEAGKNVTSLTDAGTYYIYITKDGALTKVDNCSIVINKAAAPSSSVTIKQIGTTLPQDGSINDNNAAEYFEVWINGKKLASDEVVLYCSFSSPTYRVLATSSDKNYENFTVEKDFSLTEDIGAVENGSLVYGLKPTDESITYTGSPVKPVITAQKAGEELTLDRDYKVTYNSATKAGDSITITVAGMGRYTGSYTKDYTVLPRNIADSGITVENTTILKGQSPALALKYNGKTLAKGTDFDYDTIDTTSGGTKNITITGKNNFTGSRPVTVNVTESDKDLAAATVTMSQTQLTYSGYQQAPTITLRLGNTTVATSYYTVKYKLSGSSAAATTAKPVNAGTYDVEITANTNNRGEFTGTRTYSSAFKINPLDINSSSVSASYTGSPSYNPVSLKFASVTLSYVTDYDVESYSANKTYYTVKGKGNFTGTRTVYTSTKNISNCTATFSDNRSSVSYGQKYYPKVTVYDGSKKLSEGTDYKLTYKNSKKQEVSYCQDTGTYTVVITGINAYTGTKELTFTINGTDISKYTVTLRYASVNATGSAQVPEIVSVKYGSNSSLTANDYTVSYQDANGKTVEAKNLIAPGTYKVIVTGRNGYSGSTSTTFKIVGLTQTVTVEKDSYKVYPTSDYFKITAKASGEYSGFTYTSSNPAVASVSSAGYVTPKKVGRAVITVTAVGKNKYESASKTVEVKVYPNKAKISKKPWTDGKKAQMKVRWGYQDGVTKYQVRYSRDKNFKSGTYLTKTVKAHGKDYTTQSTTLTKLKRGYTYYVKVRAVYTDPVTGDNYYGSWSGWRSAKTI